MTSTCFEEDPTKDGTKRQKFNIYKYDAQLALAFQADCENLLEKFSHSENFKFEAFAKVWMETCFIAIFERQDYILTLRNFLENCFFIAKKFLFAQDAYVQTGALYLLYSLYFKQPIKQWVKIRLNQSEADQLNAIISQHKATRFLEPSFIYFKMHLSGAFNYVALVLPLGLDGKFMKRYDLSTEEIFKKTSDQSPLESFKNLIENDTCLVELEETDREYQKLMNEYKKKCQNLAAFPSTVGKELKRAYSKIFDIELEDETDAEKDEQGHLKQVKMKAMRNMRAVYRAERDLVTGVDYQEFEANTKPSCSKDS